MTHLWNIFRFEYKDDRLHQLLSVDVGYVINMLLIVGEKIPENTAYTST
jgi:hypothetical protein